MEHEVEVEGLNYHYFYYPELKVVFVFANANCQNDVFFCRVAGLSVSQDKELQLVEGVASPLCPVLPF